MEYNIKLLLQGTDYGSKISEQYLRSSPVVLMWFSEGKYDGLHTNCIY